MNHLKCMRFLDYILTWSTFGAHENQSLFKLVDPSQSKVEQKFISDKYFISIAIEIHSDYIGKPAQFCISFSETLLKW